MWAVQHFRSWLLHRHFFIETDHANTRWILDYGMDKHNSKLCRWSCQLSKFDFEFVWKCGESMIEPDTLSRAPLPARADEPAPLASPMVTDLGKEATRFLATPRPADAAPLSRDKAKVVAMDIQQRRRERRVGMLAAVAVVAKNSAYCPDRPGPDEEITTDLPVAWSRPAPPPPHALGQPRPPAWRRTQPGTSSGGIGSCTSGAPTLFVLAHGISTDAMAAQELGLEVRGGSEVDPKLAAAFTKRTGAGSYPGVEELIEGGRRGEFSELHDLDIVTSGVPCPYRSKAGSMTSRLGKARREAGTERHLFRRQVE